MSGLARKSLLAFVVLLCAVSGAPAHAARAAGGPTRAEAADHESSSALREREAWFWQQRAGRSGIPRGALVRAMHQARQLPRGGPARSATSTFAPASGGFAAPAAASPGFQWALVGPKPVTGSGDPSGPWSGRVAAIAPDPSDSQTVYLGAASGGVWKTTNAGGSWTPLTDNNIDSMAIGALAVQPGGTGVVLAGTGEANFSQDSYYGAGIWRSLNGGTDWVKATTDHDITGCTTSRIVFDPSDPSIVFAGIVNPGTYSGPGSGNGCLNPGLYMSTDGGLNWAQQTTSSVTDVAVDPADSTKWYMGVEGDGVYPFDDTGAVGTKLSIPAASIDRISIAIAPTDSSTMYVAMTSASAGTFNASGSGIFVTQTGPTGTWSLVSSTTYRNDTNGPFLFPWYALQLQVDRSAPGTLYVASGPALGKFTSFGASFSQPAGSAAHADFHALAYAGSRLWIGTDGGVYSTDDGFSTVVNRNSNLALTQFEPGDSASTGGVLSGGTQDNGSERSGTVLDWTRLPLGCDGGWGNISASDTTDVIITPQSGCAGYYVARVNTGTNSLSHADSGITTSEAGLFYSPLVADPTNPNILYYGRTHLWTSSNRGGSWTSYASSQTFGSSISSIGASASTSTVYVGTTAGHIWSTSNGAAGPWTDSTLPAYVTDIKVDPGNSAHAYATVSGFGHDHVYETTDTGAHWNAISTSLGIDAPANGIAVDWRSGKGQVYVATDVGTFVSNDDGANWADATPGMPRAIAMNVLVDTSMDRLVVFTHGRGVWAAALGTNPPDTSITSGPSDPSNATTVVFALGASPSAGASFQCKLDDQAFEACSSNPSYSGLAPGQHTFQARAISSGGSDQTPAIAQWTIDVTAPDTSITSTPPASTTDTSAPFTFQSTETGSTFRCSLDGASFAACAASPTFTVAPGSHQIAVAAVDPAGNIDPTPATYSWVVIATATPPPQTSPAPSSPAAGTSTSGASAPAAGNTTTATTSAVTCALAKLKSLSAKKLAGGVKVGVTCTTAATAQLVLTLGKKVIASGSGPIGSSGAVKLRGSKKQLAKARKARGKLQLTAVFSAPGATAQRVTMKLTLKP